MFAYGTPSTKFCAEDATLQSLLSGFLREIDPSNIVKADDGCLLEVALRHCNAVLRAEVRYLSQTGPHGFGMLHLKFNGTPNWQVASTVQVISLVAQECFARHAVNDHQKLPEFMRAVFDSNYQIMKVMNRFQNQGGVETFLDAEQSLYFGHWLHPTPKSRDGMTDWHLDTYSPEYGGAFQLAFFAAHSSIVRSGSVLGNVDQILRDLPDLPKDLGLAEDEWLIPAHPLQAQALMLRSEIKALLQTGSLRFLGQLGGEFAPTSSVRTLYSADCPWMLKFSIPVRLTNSLRVTKRNELNVGMLMARLFDRLSFNDQTTEFQIINDPAYLTIDIPGQDESGFELIFRENPFPRGAEHSVFNIAALTADPLPQEASLLMQSVTKAAKHCEGPITDAARRWFAEYLRCCFDPHLFLYDTHGIALEAHQQNALVTLDNGMPTVGYFRDSQGYLVDRKALPDLARLVPELSDLAVLAYDSDHINSRLAYYLVINQIFAVIRRFGKDGLVCEQDLLDQFARHLQNRQTQLSGPAAGFVSYLLTSPCLQTKANLLTRLQDIDELEEVEQEGLFVEMPNPICEAMKALQCQRQPNTEERADVPT